MRIGLTSWASDIDALVQHAVQAEADGFSSLWFASAVMGDPLVPMAIIGRQTTRIELGTAVLQTFPCHPLLMANRAASAAKAIGRPGFTLGIGPSHDATVRDTYGLSYDRPGANTEEYVRILVPLLRGEPIDVKGEHWSANSSGATVPIDRPIPVLLSALGPRLLRVAGEVADGTVLWLASPRVIGEHIAPVINDAAQRAGRSAPRIVAGLPVAVHDDVDEARAAQSRVAAFYGSRPNYRRLIDLDGVTSAADLAIVGDEASVAAQLQSLLDAGATDVHAAVFPVGPDPERSMQRTHQLLAGLCD